MISTKGRYALRTMIDIARYSKGDYVPLKDISKREDISMKYLEQVVALLVRNNLLIGLRGSKGGYRLSKNASDYTAFEILTSAEGTLATVNCLKTKENTCEKCNVCTTVDFWTDFYKHIKEYLSNITLLDLVNHANDKVFSDYSI